MQLTWLAGIQMERETWRENGLAPPLPGTDAEKHWVEVDKAVPYTKVASPPSGDPVLVMCPSVSASAVAAAE